MRVKDKDDVTVKDHREMVALFRAQVLGPLLCRNPENHGELAEKLRELASQPVLPPGHELTRHYTVPTLERWYYAYKGKGIEGLKPKGKKAGFAQALTPEQRELFLETRRAHPRVSAELILRTFETQGHVESKSITASTLRRLYADAGLERRVLIQNDQGARRRWEAAAPNLLWHTDVCHGPSLHIGGRSVPLRIHALLDDHSRYVVAHSGSQ
jgi:hypothetical protein